MLNPLTLAKPKQQKTSVRGMATHIFIRVLNQYEAFCENNLIKIPLP